MWPGSHHKCFRYLTTREDGANNGYPKGKSNMTGGPDERPTWAQGMQEAWEWCEKHIIPVDCYGSAGTVVFYHNKLGHMAGQNYGENIRQAVLCGFGLSEEALHDEDLLEHAFECDIWRDWSPLVRNTGDDFGRSASDSNTGVDDDGGIAAQPMWYVRGKL